MYTQTIITNIKIFTNKIAELNLYLSGFCIVMTWDETFS